LREIIIINIKGESGERERERERKRERERGREIIFSGMKTCMY
jgi:hypothetical protein|tara:strand:+ start:58 stop:186 length:129 start_codon:yes stop_codon:yes gene_type:complete